MGLNSRMDRNAAMIALRDELRAMTEQFRKLRLKRSLKQVEKAERQLAAAKLRANGLAVRSALSPTSPRSQ